MNTRRNFLGYAAAAAATAVTSMTAVDRVARAATSRPTAAGPRAAARRPFPLVMLRDQDNRPHRLYEDLIQNRVVVINAAYAECAGICPLAVQNLKAVHKALEDRVGRDFHMLTLSLNPARDTPDRLKEYMERERVPSQGWTFLTGADADVEVTRRRLGFFDLDPVLDADRRQHTGLLTIGNDRYDWWCMTPALASPDLIVAAIDRMLRYG
jgi:protein SCO1